MSQVYKLYNKTNITREENPTLDLSIDGAFTFKVFRPTILKSGLNDAELLKRLLYYFITRGRLRIFYIMDGDQVVHYSFVIPKNFRFPFMSKGDLQIGPCFTNPNYRGRGLYAQALKLIPLLFFEQTNIFWIYTIETNIISQHVIEKAGYGFQGLVKSTGLLRILKRIKDQP